MKRSPKTDPTGAKARASANTLFLESYGVNIRISSNEKVAIEEICRRLPTMLAHRFRLTDAVSAEHQFRYVWNMSGRDSLYKDGKILVARMSRSDLLDRLGDVWAQGPMPPDYCHRAPARQRWPGGHVSIGL